uniref:Transferrin receptor protein 1-like protein n=1 Tax=Callorhinchus milii TaxID=7868 RepID=V9K8B3_CALMI
MDSARSIVSNLFGNEPRSYTRFSLARQIDGDGSRVEMKLAGNENDEEVGEVMADGMDTRIEKPQNNVKNLCRLITAILLIFLIGFLVGYLAFRGRMQKGSPINPTIPPLSSEALSKSSTGSSTEAPDDYQDNEEDSNLYFPDIKKMLQENLKSSKLVDEIWKVSNMNNHETGTDGDHQLAHYILTNLTDYLGETNVWSDSHYVNLQVSGTPNKIKIASNVSQQEISQESKNSPVYCAYSETGAFKGKLVYANYGTKADFEDLTKMVVGTISGTIVIVRAGIISFAEKVYNAEKMKAGAVLIYPDFEYFRDIAIFGHVHAGLGDPFTPGFPSFNHTQFPPTKSSGLPGILAHSISTNTAAKLFSSMSGPSTPDAWKGAVFPSKIGPGHEKNEMEVMLEVNNVNTVKQIHNVFGVIKGNEEPDHYILIGAQRDSYGPGAAESGVGTALLLELARVFSKMVQDGFKPRRSIIFASWSGGAFGSVGATEWLEGFMSMLHLKVCAYFSLDKAVLGGDMIKAFGSPLMFSLIENAMMGVKSPMQSSETIYERTTARNHEWEKAVLTPIPMDTSVYAFLVIGGIPSVGLRFAKENSYQYNGTMLDTTDKLLTFVDHRLEEVSRAMAEMIGHMVIKLTHDHHLPLDYRRYTDELVNVAMKIDEYNEELNNYKLDAMWFFSAKGDYYRAAQALEDETKQSDLTNVLLTRSHNNRIMRVEYNFLSTFVSQSSCPFRHLLYGNANHTISGIVERLKLLRENRNLTDINLIRTDLAYATWTIQGAANALSGEIWTIKNIF